jgi:hypothetical protein
VSWPPPLTAAQLGVLLALVGALLFALHLQKPRPSRTRVSFLAAWDEIAPDRAASPARWALARSWALLRALLFAALVAVALSDPQPFAGSARTTLLVLDAGAHMLATDESPSRFERARALALSAVDARADAETMSIAQLDSALTPLSGLSRDAQQLRAAVAVAQPGRERTRFEALSEFARARLAGQPRPEVVLVSDGAFDVAPAELAQLRDAGIGLRQIRVGRSARNLAIRAFAMRAYPWDAARSEAMLELENTDASAQTIELTLYEGAKPIDVRSLALPARSRARHFFGLGASGSRFTAKIVPAAGPPDDQRLDDVAYAVLAQPPPRRVLLVTAGQRYLESALALDPRLVVERIAPDAYTSADGYDLAIFDRFVPTESPNVPSLWLAPEPAGKDAAAMPYRVLGTIDRPFFDDVDSDAPLLRAVSLRDVNVRRAARVQPDAKDRIIARSRHGPLIVEGEHAGQRFIAFAFDPAESDLVLRTAWPVLLTQAVQQLTAAATAVVETPLWVGRAQPRDVGADARNQRPEQRAERGSANLLAPSGRLRSLEVRSGQVWLTPAETGFHELTFGESREVLAVNVDPDASAKIEPRTLAAEPTMKVEVASLWQGRDAPWLLLLLAALLIFAIDACFASRRSSS